VINDDNILEEDESFILLIDASSLLDSVTPRIYNATVTIINDDSKFDNTLVKYHAFNSSHP